MAAPVVIVPIFPLPDVTFFPHTLMPLHVFEARYRAMVTDVLERDRRLAVVRLQPGYEATYAGKPAVHPVAGLGEIVCCERLATGRYNILLRGEAACGRAGAASRHALSRRRGDRAGRRGAVTARPCRRYTARVKEQCLQILEAVGRTRAEMNESLDAVRSPGELCDQVASAVLPGPAVRQALLEELDVGSGRLQRLTVGSRRPIAGSSRETR